MEIFKLFGSVFVDTKKAEESTHKMGEKADGIGSKFTKGIKKAAKWGAAITAGAVAGGAALLKTATNAAETTDRIDKMSQKLGISRKGFQELDFVMSQSGMSIDSFGTGMKSLLGKMEASKNGNKNATSSFQALGVAVTDSSGKLRSQEAVLADTIKAFQGMEDGSEKARLAQELFGRQGQEIMPLLNGQAGSFEELTAKAHELGIVIGDEAIDSGVKLTDTIDQSKRAFGGIMTTIGVSLMPVIQKFLDFILAHMPEIRMVMSTVFKAISVVVMSVVDVFKQFFFPIIQGIVEWISSNWSTIADVIGSVMETVRTIIDTVWSAISVLWQTYGDSIKMYVQGAFNMISTVIKSVMNIIKGVINLVMSIIKGDWSGAWDGIKSIVTGIFDGILAYIKYVVNAIKSVISAVWNTIVSITTGVWNGIKNAIMTPFQAAFNFVKGLVDKIKGLFSFKFTWPKIPLPHFSVEGSLNPIKWLSDGLPKIKIDWYAKGAIMKKPTMFGFDPYSMTAHVGGEAGPEAIAPIGTLQGYVASAVASQNGRLETILISILEIIKEIDNNWSNRLREVLNEYGIELNDREIGRLIRKYV